MKGLTPSFDPDHDSFVWGTHNWNQVCNAGMAFGAIAVMDEYPSLANKTINRAIESIPRAMVKLGLLSVEIFRLFPY